MVGGRRAWRMGKAAASSSHGRVVGVASAGVTAADIAACSYRLPVEFASSTQGVHWAASSVAMIGTEQPTADHLLFGKIRPSCM